MPSFTIFDDDYYHSRSSGVQVFQVSDNKLNKSLLLTSNEHMILMTDLCRKAHPSPFKTKCPTNHTAAGKCSIETVIFLFFGSVTTRAHFLPYQRVKVSDSDTFLFAFLFFSLGG